VPGPPEPVALASAPPVPAEAGQAWPRSGSRARRAWLWRVWAPAPLDESAALEAEPRVACVAELREHPREHRAAFEGRRLRAQQHDGAPGQAAQPSVAWVSAAQRLAPYLDPDSLGRLRELGQYALGIHCV
jgi:hypothetical protein